MYILRKPQQSGTSNLFLMPSRNSVDISVDNVIVPVLNPCCHIYNQKSMYLSEVNFSYVQINDIIPIFKKKNLLDMQIG